MISGKPDFCKARGRRVEPVTIEATLRVRREQHDGAPLAVAGQMGVTAAAEVIGHMGPRPEADLKALFRRAGLV